MVTSLLKRLWGSGPFATNQRRICTPPLSADPPLSLPPCLGGRPDGSASTPTIPRQRSDVVLASPQVRAPLVGILAHLLAGVVATWRLAASAPSVGAWRSGGWAWEAWACLAALVSASATT